MVRQDWPEGSAADPDAARARYEQDLREARGAGREALRAGLADAHVGLGLVLAVAVAVGCFKGVGPGALVLSAFLVLFCALLAGRVAGGARGRDLVRPRSRWDCGLAPWF
ncbi:hypothetical protein ACFV4M_23980 [Kitasatospora indigofera]|uniref:hypothetical protein n=1 Tax=Kitasatospora indigofera TaxID=67307 RepID=UPI0036539CDB